MNTWQKSNHYRQLTAEIATWIEPYDPERAIATFKNWDAATWEMTKRTILMQGVGPWLNFVLPATPLWQALPESIQEWLQFQYQMNRQRIERMHGDLHAILYAANRAGIAVLPLKGSVLSILHYPDPALRPMSDIDLLVQPQDFAAMAQLLLSLGYKTRAASYDDGHHHEFDHPSAHSVVSFDCEHPDNPRSIELFDRLRRILWYGASIELATLQPFANSIPATLLGEAVVLPDDKTLFLLIATHANKHLLRDSGRLINLIDLSFVAKPGLAIEPAWANWVYPALEFARRLRPTAMAIIDLLPIAADSNPTVRRWAETTSFAGDCGLINFGESPKLLENSWNSYFFLWWSFWKPSAWRIATAFGDVPLPIAYARYGTFLVGRAGKKVWGLLKGRMRRKLKK